MSDKFYVGKDLVSYSDNGTYKPVSRVTLLLDDENCVTSGDDTGFELVADCPYATQVMADALLASFVGYEYKAYKAVAVNIDPSAELGDGLTADDNYVVISRVDDDGNGYPTLSAVGEAEMEDEYPSTGPMTQKFDRQLAQTRSLISKTAEEITLLVEKEIAGLGDQFTELKVTLDGVTVTDANGTTLIKGSSIETDTLYVNAANISGKLVANQIDATDLVLTNSANIANNFIVDQYGNVTINGNINFSGGSITWGANDPADGSGISASEARTIISEQLVSSPNIAGGKFWNLDMDTWVEVGDDDEHYGLTVNNNYWGILFGVYDGDMAYTSFCAKLEYYFLLVDGDSQKSFPRGTWDFSGATVTGLDISSTATAVFG